QTDQEGATCADARARKRRRFAFPDDFNAGLRRFRDRIRRMEGKGTPAGRVIEALDEIRVQVSPEWGAAKVTVFFWFLLEPDKISDFEATHQIVRDWMSAINLSGAFVLADPAFEIVEPRDMTVDHYQASHALDYDDLSP